MQLQDIAALCVVSGAAILIFVAGQVFQLITSSKDIAMASASNAALASAIADLLAENTALKAASVQPQAALADETAAEDALTAQIRAVVPAAPQVVQAEPAA